MSDQTLAVIEVGVRLNGKTAIAVRAPFSPSFGDALKALVPASDREFRFNTKSWVILKKHKDDVDELVLRFFGEYVTRGGKDDGVISTRDGAFLKQETLAL